MLFEVWAPNAQQVEILTDGGTHAMADVWFAQQPQASATPSAVQPTTATADAPTR